MRNVIIRHPREKLEKCSLTPLMGRPDFLFYTWSPELRVDATGYILLAVDAPVLSIEDAGLPMLVLDSTWRLLPSLERAVVGAPTRRSLPLSIQTAYPRKSKDGSDPPGGLASVEAVYAALRLVGRADESLLESYYWAEEFLRRWPSGH